MSDRDASSPVSNVTARDRWRERLAAWRRYREWEGAAGTPRSASDLLAAATWLYDRLPAAARVREIDPSGLARMRACLSVLGRRR